MPIKPASIPEDIPVVRALFEEYLASLAVDLGFQDVPAELAGLPGKYAAPRGVILLARALEGHALGCIAVRPADDLATAELKRLYVRPQARGHELGRRLTEAALRWCREAGYGRVILDTLPFMASAQRLYGSLGFRPIAPYYDNPITGSQFLGREL
jgi:putative acetyltransferase